MPGSRNICCSGFNEPLEPLVHVALQRHDPQASYCDPVAARALGRGARQPHHALLGRAGNVELVRDVLLREQRRYCWQCLCKTGCANTSQKEHATVHAMCSQYIKMTAVHACCPEPHG